MKNTLKNKAKFFAQYWDQKIMKNTVNKKLHDCPNQYLLDNTLTENDYLELKQLKNLTPEEESIMLEKLEVYGNTEYKHLQISDFLKANNYALHYTNKKGETLNINQLLEYGWIKLKQ